MIAPPKKKTLMKASAETKKGSVTGARVLSEESVAVKQGTAKHAKKSATKKAPKDK